MNKQREQTTIRTNTTQAGFTIIELMIATLVFSGVLLIITYGVIHFTSSYYKGINSSTTQVTAQKAVDTIGQAIQFSTGGTAGTATVPTPDHFCAGSKMFAYTTGTAYSSSSPIGPNNWGLFMMDNQSATCAAIPSPIPSGTELLSNNMRITDVTLASVASAVGTGGLWQLTLKVAYGTTDLLCSPSVAGSCNSTSPLSPAQLRNPDVVCRSQIGQQFCSTVALSSVIQQRIVN
jgi:prepilin-type N-terminal cleavage/methylation domain-containing protein